MNPSKLRQSLATGLLLLTLFALVGDTIAQSKNRFARKRDDDRKKTVVTPPPAVREPAAPVGPVAQVAEPVAIPRPTAAPVATPVATPIAEIGTNTSNPTPTAGSAIPSLSDVTSKLPEMPKEVETILSDTRVQDLVNKAKENQGQIMDKAQEAYKNVNNNGGTPEAAVSTITSTVSPPPVPTQETAASTPPAPTPTPTQPLTSTPSNVVAPQPLQPKYQRETADAPNSGGDRSVGTKQDGEVMKIRANESEMNQENALITFRGDVFVVEPTFTLYSDQLDVYQYKEGETPAVNDKGEEQNIKRAIATGSIVEIKRIDKDGVAQVAQARRADYDAATGKVVLTGGPPVLQSGGRLVQTSSPDAKIILTPDGNQQIIDRGVGGTTGGGSMIVIPINKKVGGKEPNVPTGSLDSIRTTR